LRIAKHHTGKSGIIITEEAYHGNSDMTAGFSPSLGVRSPLGTWVRRVPAPDSYGRVRAHGYYSAVSSFIIRDGGFDFDRWRATEVALIDAGSVRRAADQSSV
jgi:4-aminobutyrate aminotransferase-like enzyme